MTNQCLARGSPKPVVHKAHANAFISFPVARNFLPLPILAALLSFLFFFFSFPSPFFYFKFHRSGFNGFLPLPPFALSGEYTSLGSRSSWTWISEMVIDAPFDPEPETCSRPRRIFGRGLFDVPALSFFPFPSMLLVNAMIRSKNAEYLIITIIIISCFTHFG